MAIKQFTFSFKLDAKDLLEFISEHNVAVDIQAFGSGPRNKKGPKALAAPPTLALPAPDRKNFRAGDAIVACLIASPEYTANAETIKELLVKTGFSGGTFNNCMWKLRHTGFVKTVGRGLYRATPRAVKQAGVTHG